MRIVILLLRDFIATGFPLLPLYCMGDILCSWVHLYLLDCLNHGKPKNEKEKERKLKELVQVTCRVDVGSYTSQKSFGKGAPFEFLFPKLKILII